MNRGRQWLEEEINEERQRQGKKPLKYEDNIIEKKVKINKTDKESGYYHRDNKENGFMYLDHRTTDGKANIIVDCYITKGNIHDSVPYIERLEYVKNTYGFKIKNVALDSGYDSLDIKKYLYDNEIFGVIGYRRHGTTESRNFKRNYTYKEEQDIYINKETGEVLEYKGLIDRNGYKKYKSLNNEIIILRHIKENINEHFIENRLSQKGKELYKLRKIKIERSFADSKQNHGYRYAMHRGIKKNQNYAWLICAAQNMKNISLKKEKVENKSLFKEKVLNTLSKTLNFIKPLRNYQNKNKPQFYNWGLSTV